MLLLFSKGRSLPARTQPPSPSICLWSVSPSPCRLDQILTEAFILFDTSSGFAAICGKTWQRRFFKYLEYKECIRKLLWYSILKWNSCLLSQTSPEFSTVAFSCLPVFFHTFLHLPFLLPFPCLSPPLPDFPSFDKSLPVPVAYFSSTWLCRQENQTLLELCRGKTKGWLGINIHFLLQGDKAGDVSGFLLKMTCCQELESLFPDLWTVSLTHWKCFSTI